MNRKNDADYDRCMQTMGGASIAKEVIEDLTGGNDREFLVIGALALAALGKNMPTDDNGLSFNDTVDVLEKMMPMTVFAMAIDERE